MRVRVFIFVNLLFKKLLCGFFKENFFFFVKLFLLSFIMKFLKLMFNRYVIYIVYIFVDDLDMVNY